MNRPVPSLNLLPVYKEMWDRKRPTDDYVDLTHIEEAEGDG